MAVRTYNAKTLHTDTRHRQRDRHTDTQTRRHIHITHAHAHTYTYTHKHMHTHARARAHTHHTHTHTHTYTHTHTHDLPATALYAGDMTPSTDMCVLDQGTGDAKREALARALEKRAREGPSLCLSVSLNRHTHKRKPLLPGVPWHVLIPLPVAFAPAPLPSFSPPLVASGAPDCSVSRIRSGQHGKRPGMHAYIHTYIHTYMREAAEWRLARP
jgi:hypothetical protein